MRSMYRLLIIAGLIVCCPWLIFVIVPVVAVWLAFGIIEAAMEAWPLCRRSSS